MEFFVCPTMTDSISEMYKALIFLSLLATARGLNQVLAHGSDIRENLT